MSKDVPLKVRAQLEEFDAILKDALKHDIIPDRTYTQITAKIGHIDSTYMNEQFKNDDEKYYHWVKNRLDKISELLTSFPKHSEASLKNPDEDLIHVTGDYYNEDNSISLTPEIKLAINNIITDNYSS